MSDKYEKLVDEAYNLHVSGKLEEAKQVYEKLIELNPDNLDVLNLYAQLNFSLRNFDTALKIFSEIYEKTHLDEIKINIIKVYLQQNDFQNVIKTIDDIENKDVQVLRYLAQAYFGLNEFKLAIDVYINIIKTGQASLGDIFNLSLNYLKNNDLENALKYALEVYSQNKKEQSVCLHIASIYQLLNDNENQLKYLLKASEISPSVELFYNIGVMYRILGDDAVSLEYFKAIVDAQPDHKYALLNIARIYQNHDKNITVQILSDLANKYPDDSLVLSQLYITYKNMMDFSSACEIALKLIKLNPDEGYAYSFAGDALYYLGKYNEALDMYNKALEKDKDSEYLYSMLATIYSAINQSDKAIEIYKTKLPEKMKTDYAYAYIQLKERNLEEGREAMYAHLSQMYTEKEVEERAIQMFYKLNLDKKFSVNEDEFKQYKTGAENVKIERVNTYLKKTAYQNDFDNSKFLVYHASGLGDLLMFTRYVKLLEHHTDKIILQVPKSMKRLIEFNYPNHKTVLDDYTVNEKEYDYSSSFFNLLCCLPEITLRNIPFSQGYLSVDDEWVKEKSNYDELKTKKKKVGIFWQGNPNISAQRSIKLKELLPIFELDNIEIYSFQISDIDFESDELKKKLPIKDLAPYISDFADTGAFLKNMDLLISIDTSIANLAGALGIKTFLLLPYETEWRWFYDTDKTPWYDSIKIFKQTVPLVWTDVVERLKNELTV